MNYWPQLVQSLLLMLIFSNFGIKIKGQPSTGLNPYAQEFHPQGQLIPNSPQAGPPTSQFISNVAHHQFQSSHSHRSSQQMAEDPIKLPDFLYDYEENEHSRKQSQSNLQIDGEDFKKGHETSIILPDSLSSREEKGKTEVDMNQGNKFAIPEMVSSNQDVHIIPTEVEKSAGSRQDGHFTPTAIEKSKENSQDGHLATSVIEQPAGSQDTVIFKPILKVGEKPDKPGQSKVELVHQEELKNYLEHGKKADIKLDNKQHIGQSTKSIDQKEEALSYINKLMTPIEQKSPPSSKRGKQEQQRSQHLTDRGGNISYQSHGSSHGGKKNRSVGSASNLSAHSSTHTHKQSVSKTGEIATVMGITPRNLEKAPEHGAPVINVSKKGELKILDRASVGKESRFNPLYNPQEHKQLDEEEDKDIDGHNQKLSRKLAKSKGKGKDKQKVVLTKEEIKSMKIREKEENEFLKKEAENRRKKIEKQKLEEEQQIKIAKSKELKMDGKKEEKLQEKQKFHNVFSSSKMTLKKEVKGKQLSHPILSVAPPTDSTITTNVQMHGEEVGCSGSRAAGEESAINESINSSSLQIPQQSTTPNIETELLVIKKEIERNKKIIERNEKLIKFNQIKKFLENMQKNLDEIQKLEHNWLIERIKQFNEKDKNKNWNEKEEEEEEEEEIQQFRIEIRKFSYTNELIKNEKENIEKLIELKEELRSLLDKDSAILKNSSINKMKQIKDDKDKPVAVIKKLTKLCGKIEPAIEKLTKLCGEIEDKEAQLMEKQNNEKELQKQINELQKSLIYNYNFLKLNNYLEQETEKMKEIQKQMEDPLKHLWIGYDLVIKKLDQHWKTPEMKEEYYDRLPFDYNFIHDVFHGTMSTEKKENAAETNEELLIFHLTMKLTLEKMLLHQNIFRNMNFTTNVNGEKISVYERLNCFDELSKKMKMLDKENELLNKHYKDLKIIKFEKMKIMIKYFKEELNQKFRDVLRFIMVGFDELPDVWDQMVLKGIKELTEWWLPENRKRQMDKIWIALFNYYLIENNFVQFLSKYVYDKVAENIFDLTPDNEYFQERLEKQLTISNELHDRINSLGISEEVKKFMADAFDHIKAWIQSIKMLLKIEKREKDAKPLPFLKSVYEKYWYMIYKDRFDHHYEYVREYKFDREIEQKERAKIIKELLDKAKFERNPKVKEIFQQIAIVDPGILYELMKIIDVLDDFVTEIKIKDRLEKYENDLDFMNSIRKANNPNIEHYNSLWVELYGDVDSKDDA